MSLELVLGCMKSGKSTYLIEKAMAFKATHVPVFIVNHSCDTRYGTSVVANHNRYSVPCVSTDKLMELETNEDFCAARWILVDEAHFFPDLLDFVKLSTDRLGKHLIVVGLSGDFKREKFGQVLDCVPYAERILHHVAMCETCCDGTVAVFSKRIDSSKEQVLVGGSDKYIAVCRKHMN